MRPARAHLRTAIACLALCGWLASTAHAEPIDRSFPAGVGARFSFSSAVANGELVLSIATSSASRVAVECFFAAAGRSMWEQFVIDLTSGAPTVSEGYLLTAEASAPERIPPAALQGLSDLMLTDFLISTRAQLDRYKKGVEQLTVPASAAPITATRYEHTKGGQTLTFWLSDAARPLGLVKLESRGDKMSQRYTLLLVSGMKNVGRKIDPAKAVPLSSEGQALLEAASR